jgi:uncharacterized membrane protein YfcA
MKKGHFNSQEGLVIYLVTCMLSLVGFILLAIYSQNAILKIKISCLFRFSIARIQPKFKKKGQISIHGSLQVAKKEEDLKK